MRKLLFSALFTLLPAVSFAQSSDLVGLEVRSPERDQVLGEVMDVRDDRAIIQLEAHDKPVAVELSRLQRVGNKLLLPLSEDELAQLPPAEDAPPSGSGQPSDRPMGGTTPGWGSQQGGWNAGESR